MTLHTINKSPFSSNSFDECLKYCSANSAILLIEDGVYAAQRGTSSAAALAQLKNISIYALAADTDARGLTDSLSECVIAISDHEFVRLVEKFRNMQSWY